MQYNAAMSEEVEDSLASFLLHDVSDEEISFATWFPAAGKSRFTALVYDPIFPREGDRKRHGNVSALPHFVDRAKETSREHGGGLAIIHTHPDGEGWQGLSDDDDHFEREVLAREVLGITGLPLLGLTLSGDRVWSARVYPRTERKPPVLEWCSAVRIVGKRLKLHFNPKMKPAPTPSKEQTRTTSVWGKRRQSDIMRLRVGLIGAGSVGSIVGELLARVGVGEMYVVDFDIVKPHNLDRLLGASRTDAKKKKKKAIVVSKNALRASTTPNFRCTTLEDTSIVEDDGYAWALDCDVLFSCVDRPWPRQVLNHIAYSCLIPVVDGGVSFKTGADFKLIHGMFRAQTVGPQRACLDCLGSYDPRDVQMDREGQLEDPIYVEELKMVGNEPSRQNVMPFVAGLAGLETIQFVELVTGLANIGDIGQQPYDYRTGEILPINKTCSIGCLYPDLIARGDSKKPVLGQDKSKARSLVEAGVL